MVSLKAKAKSDGLYFGYLAYMQSYYSFDYKIFISHLVLVSLA